MGKQAKKKTLRKATRITPLQWVRMARADKIRASSDMVAAAILAGALTITISGKEDLKRYAILLSSYLDGNCEQLEVRASSCKIGEFAAIGMVLLGWAKKKSLMERIKDKFKTPKPEGT